MDEQKAQQKAQELPDSDAAKVVSGEGTSEPGGNPDPPSPPGGA